LSSRYLRYFGISQRLSNTLRAFSSGFPVPFYSGRVKYNFSFKKVGCIFTAEYSGLRKDRALLFSFDRSWHGKFGGVKPTVYV
jgi:hypothetical protein